MILLQNIWCDIKTVILLNPDMILLKPGNEFLKTKYQ